ncbi:MAG: ribosome-associated translation inhibitor RaiA [Chitinophagaceae bacterium]|nr:ribosome-associated translation inhibitor RaiA [Chitinophagaceae bacterium]
MKINLQCLKFTAKDRLRDFVNEKVSKLEKFDDRILSAEVTLSVQDGKHVDNKACDIRLVVPGNDLIVKRSAVTFQEAILIAVETLQETLKRKKDKTSQSDKSATIG